MLLAAVKDLEVAVLNNPLTGLRSYSKKAIFKKVEDVIEESGYRDQRLIFNEIKNKYFDGDMPETHKNAYLYVINKKLRELK